MKKMKFVQSMVLSAAMLGFTSAIPGMQQAVFAENAVQVTAMQAPVHMIQVSGEGRISVAPDIAYIQLGVQTQETSVSQAQNKNAQVLQKVYAALEKKQIKKEDIQTVAFNVNPIYTWDQDKRVFQGYQVEHLLRVTDRDLVHIGQLLDMVTQAGANRIDSIQYDTVKREQIQLEALDLAMDDASRKANHLAKKIGKPIQSVMSIQENSGSPGPIFAAYAKSAASDAAQTQISTGEIVISASVDVSYGF